MALSTPYQQTPIFSTQDPFTYNYAPHVSPETLYPRHHQTVMQVTSRSHNESSLPLGHNQRSNIALKEPRSDIRFLVGCTRR